MSEMGGKERIDKLLKKTVQNADRVAQQTGELGSRGSRAMHAAAEKAGIDIGSRGALEMSLLDATESSLNDSVRFANTAMEAVQEALMKVEIPREQKEIFLNEFRDRLMYVDGGQFQYLEDVSNVKGAVFGASKKALVEIQKYFSLEDRHIASLTWWVGEYLARCESTDGEALYQAAVQGAEKGLAFYGLQRDGFDAAFRNRMEDAMELKHA